MGLLELQQGRKIKKQACWNSSKGKKSKRWPAGIPARPKIKKTGLLELQQAKKMRQTLARLPYDAIKQWCQRLRHHA